MNKPKTHQHPGQKQHDQHHELQLRLTEMETNWKRALADYQNLEKRTREQQTVMAQMANLTLIERLLPVLDNLELAAKHINDPGLQMVIKQFADALEEEGVIKIEAENQPFDPERMESIEQVPGEKDKVMTVVTNGYMIGNRVIRPARVQVGNGEEAK